LSPLLLVKIMIKKSYIKELADRHLQGTDKFVAEVVVKSGNVITIVIDSDTAVLIDDCINLSKAVESSLDRDVEDFELRVTSYGADKPLISKRQYVKNIGIDLQFVTNENLKLIGKLINVDKENITLELPINKKKKESVPEILNVPFAEINQTKVVLAFK
jgi:ribosome maturation factor RimP